MQWLTQNWISLLVLVGVILFMRSSGMGCGFGGRRARMEHSHDDRRGGADAAVEPAPLAADPVSQRPVDPAAAVATLYQGRAYYFESRDNRDRFEAAPEQYAMAPSEGDKTAGHAHQGGCC